MTFEYTSQPPTRVYDVLRKALGWYDIFDTLKEAKHGFSGYPLEYNEECFSALNELLGHSNPQALLGCSLLGFLCFTESDYFLEVETEEEARLWLIEFAEFLRDVIRVELKRMHGDLFDEDTPPRKYAIIASRSRKYFFPK